MTTKQRDVIFQRWSGMIRREIRDRASLELVSARAMNDPDVRDDATLSIMIRCELDQSRGKLEHELQRQASSRTLSETRHKDPAVPPTPIPQTTPEQDRLAFNHLALRLCASLERNDERDIRADLVCMRVLQERSPGVIPAALIADYEQRVVKLRLHLQHLTDQVETLAKLAVSASRAGNEQDLARSLRRLLAIQAAHPRLLEETRLNTIRADVIHAADERRQHRLTTGKLLDRERTIAAEIKKLAVAVHEFHRVACTVPENSGEFRDAEAAYLRTIQQVRAHDTEWFSGVVLELADLLAEWTLPPLGAEGQIDRFLDGINTGLERVRAEMNDIENEQDSEDGDARASATN